MTSSAVIIVSHKKYEPNSKTPQKKEKKTIRNKMLLVPVLIRLSAKGKDK